MLALAPAAASAQSLRELYEAAHAYDATYLAARALADSAIYRVEQTRALNRASASLAGNVARVESNPTVGSNFSSNGFGLTVNGRQPLFNRSNDATIAQAELTLESSLADLDTAEQDLMLRVSQAYFDVLGAQDTLQTTRANKAAISEQLASAKRNFEVGTATITDTREAQARFDLATAQEIAADNDLVTKRIALDQLVGRNNVQPRQLAVPVALPATAAIPVDDLVGRAAEEHPAVRRARVGFDVAQLETEKARAQRLPTVDAVASVQSGRGTIAANVTGYNSVGSVGLQVNVPLYSGGSIQNRIRETLVLEERCAQRPRGGATHGDPDDAPGVLHAAVGRGAGEGARGGRGVEPARARGDAARLPRRHSRQRRRAQRAEPAVPDPARPGAGALRPAARHVAAAPGVGAAGSVRHPGD